MEIFDSPLFPNLVYLLLMAGLWFAALAVVSPGTGVLELVTLVSLAAVGLATIILPLNVWAVALLIAGGVLFVISLQRSRPEIWLSISALVLSLGSVFMFEVEDGLMAVHPCWQLWFLSSRWVISGSRYAKRSWHSRRIRALIRRG